MASGVAGFAPQQEGRERREIPFDPQHDEVAHDRIWIVAAPDGVALPAVRIEIARVECAV